MSHAVNTGTLHTGARPELLPQNGGDEMEDEIQNGEPTFTVGEAQRLRSSFLRLLLERDELEEKLQAHMLVLRELEDLRRFIDDPTPFAAVASTNGHRSTAHAPTERYSNGTHDGVTPSVGFYHVDDAAPVPQRPTDDTASAPMPPAATPADDCCEQTLVRTHTGNSPQADDDQGNQLGATRHTEDPPSTDTAGNAGPDPDQAAAPMVTPPDNTAAPDDQGERLQADDAPSTCVKADDDARPAVMERHTGETSADDTVRPDVVELHTGEGPQAANSQGEQAPNSPQRPPADSLMERVLTAIEQNSGPIQGWKVQRQLQLPRSASPELSRLLAQGHIVRVREGLYAMADSPNI
jgi:hypothetical protein